MIQQLKAKYTLFDSVEELLAPETLSDLLNTCVSQVNYQPFVSSDSFSGSRLYNVTADDVLLVMKRINLSQDWISIAAEDRLCRSVRVWQYGLLDRIQPHMDHAIVAACSDGDEYLLLMHDVSEGLFDNKEITPQTIYALLDALAAMHAMFWEDEALKDPELGLCTPDQMVKTFWKEHLHRYRHDNKATEYINAGWDAFFELVPPDVCDAVQQLMEDPQPLFRKLAQLPATLVHGDYRLGNLALMPKTNQVIAFDWQHAGYAPATLCLSWFIMGDNTLSVNEAAEYYRQQLATRLGKRFDPDLWQQMLDLGCMADALRKGNWPALFSVSHSDEAVRIRMKQSVYIYSDAIRKGLKWF
jgi:hypothetical protein